MTIDRLWLLAVSTLLFLTACQSTPNKSETPKKLPAIAVITDQRLPEISGLAASKTHDSYIWAINDSGNNASIYLIDQHLSVEQAVELDIQNRDWEDLAAFSLHGEAWIVIAETGDNLHQYDHYKLYFYRENRLLHSDGMRLAPDISLRYSYEQGSVNCEAIAIDPSSETILLFGKTNSGTPVHSLNLATMQASSPVEAKLLTTIPAYSNNAANGIISALTGINLDSTTAATISDDGNNLFLLTYNDIWHFERDNKQNWKDTFQIKATHFASHELRQAEALTVDSKSRRLLITSEKLPAPVLEFNY